MFLVNVKTSEDHDIVFYTKQSPVVVYENPNESKDNADFVRIGDDMTGVILPAHTLICALFQPHDAPVYNEPWA